MNKVLAVVYDPNGFIDDHFLLEKLQNAQQRVFARWLEAPTHGGAYNVLPFSGEKS